jgi:hypothetical protein
MLVLGWLIPLRPGRVVVLGPDGEQPTIGAVTQKWCRGILFVMAEALLRFETNWREAAIGFRQSQISAAGGQDQVERATNGGSHESSYE